MPKKGILKTGQSNNNLGGGGRDSVFENSNRLSPEVSLKVRKLIIKKF